jgi:ribokinase
VEERGGTGDIPYWCINAKKMTELHCFERSQGLVFSLGSINADFQVRVPRQPTVSETLLAHEFARFAGGKAANVAVLVHQLGTPVRLFGHIGDDDLAAQATQPLRNIGLDLSGIKKIVGAQTGMAMITVPPNGAKGIIYAPNANEIWTDDEAREIASAVADAPENSVLVIDCEIPGFVLELAAQSARQRGFPVLLDPSPADRVTDRLLQLSDIVLPNAGEAKQLSGVDCRDAQTARNAGERLMERGAAAVCIKLSDGACVLVDKEQTICVAAMPVTVIDTTGAGDAFAGAMAVAMLERRSRVESVRFAAAASHIAVTRYGAQPSYPTRKELESLLHRLDVRTETTKAGH